MISPISKRKLRAKKLKFLISVPLFSLLTSSAFGQDSVYLNKIYLHYVQEEWQNCKIYIWQVPTTKNNQTKLNICITAPQNSKLIYTLEKTSELNKDHDALQEIIYFEGDTLAQFSYILKANNECYDIKFYKDDTKMMMRPKIFSWKRKEVKKWINQLKKGESEYIYSTFDDK